MSLDSLHGRPIDLSQCLDDTCASFKDYQAKKRNLIDNGYLFIGNFSADPLCYREIIELDKEAGKRVDFELQEERLKGKFSHYVDEVTWWYRKRYCEIWRLSAYSSVGSRLDDQVAFFVKEVLPREVEGQFHSPEERENLIKDFLSRSLGRP